MREFLFLAGESYVTLPLVFSKPNWEHTSVPDYLVYADHYIRRSLRPREIIKGVIHYADVHDKDIEKSNLELIVKANIPCWPNPNILLRMLDRHKVLEDCAEFITHDFYQDYSYSGQIKFPFVLKTGNSHRGIGKYLIKSEKDIPTWDGIATMEPFFTGDSVRVLIIGDSVFGLRVENENSWIKNAPGAEVYEYTPDIELVNHAKMVMDKFGLDLAGVDYIVNDSGFHFLEINQYPGIGSFDDVEECVREFLKKKMLEIEGLAI